MPRRKDLRSICLIGSGPIVIGQACEFDYAGCQALKVLREDGFRTIVVNSNPATIMTDPGFADATYLEPLDLDGVAAVLRRERPDALLPTLGGQTALNLARRLAECGVLADLGIELIGASLEAINRAEDRERFRACVHEAGLRTPRSTIVIDLSQVTGLATPAVVRPAFTLGGHGGGLAQTPAELRAQVQRGLAESPIGQVLVEESLLGWDEFELEVVRDAKDNVVVVCSIENLDPMGVHTGDSVTVAPQMTLSDESYQELRDAAIAMIRAVGVDTGGSNIQFARERETGDIRVIEMNPRVSRSSALASKATGYPIAKVAAKLAVGYTLEEIPNDLTGTTPASFEPSLDYVVVKFPRFAFEKFPGAERRLGTQMKSVGEAMGIGRTFTEAFLKAHRSRELDQGAEAPWSDLGDLPPGIHPWFRGEVERIRAALSGLGSLGELVADDWVRLKRLGLSDLDVAEACGASEADARAARRVWGVRPAFRRVDSCAGEVAARSNYFYSTWGEAEEAVPTGEKPRVVILGSGPNRIGQGIEFDYCCVHAARSFRALGYEAVMVNCNPETVSTDYDTSDRLYFEPLRAEEVLAVCERERADGVVIQFGGQTPLRLARALEAAGFRIMGTPFDAIDLAEDRARFAGLLQRLGIRCPDWEIVTTWQEAVEAAARIGYPVLVRPSYVLGGRAMRICTGPEDVRAALAGHDKGPVLVDRFLEGAVEIDVEALGDGKHAQVVAILEHVERAGVHSGDSTCILPAPSLNATARAEVVAVVERLATALGVVGLLNVQLAIADGEVFVLEANPRASRTVPFASKAIGANLVEAACRLAARVPLGELDLPRSLGRDPGRVSVKAAVLPFARFPEAHPTLGPEMRSTGEAMATAADLPTALAKAERAAGRPLPPRGVAFVSAPARPQAEVVDLARRLDGAGFLLAAPPPTARVLRAAGLACDAGAFPPAAALAVVEDGGEAGQAASSSGAQLFLTLESAAAALHGLQGAHEAPPVSLQELHERRLGCLPTPKLAGVRVLKFGGTSVADTSKIRAAARRLVAAAQQGRPVVGVLSAMGDTTDELIGLARQLSPTPPPREYDMLLAAGEQVSNALCAIAIAELGHEAISLNGAQAGIRTDGEHGRARVLEVRADRIVEALAAGKIVLVAGFQGVVDETEDVTTLGRGGSDLTAVALAAALGAKACEIYSDVGGVHSADPWIVPAARKLPMLTYDEMVELAASGAGVLELRSIELARRHGVELHVRSARTHAPGTAVVGREEPVLEQPLVKGVTHTTGDTIYYVQGVGLAELATALADAGLDVGTVVRMGDELVFTARNGDRHEVPETLTRLGVSWSAADGFATVSVVGAALKNAPEVASVFYRTLTALGIEPELASTTPTRISCHVASERAYEAVRAIHRVLVEEEPAAAEDVPPVRLSRTRTRTLEVVS